MVVSWHADTAGCAWPDVNTSHIQAPYIFPFPPFPPDAGMDLLSAGSHGYVHKKLISHEVKTHNPYDSCWETLPSPTYSLCLHLQDVYKKLTAPTVWPAFSLPSKLISIWVKVEMYLCWRSWKTSEQHHHNVNESGKPVAVSTLSQQHH